MQLVPRGADAFLRLAVLPLFPGGSLTEERRNVIDAMLNRDSITAVSGQRMVTRWQEIRETGAPAPLNHSAHLFPWSIVVIRPLHVLIAGH